MSRLLFDLDEGRAAERKLSGWPLLVRIAGAGASVRRITRQCRGPVDAAPVDFPAWADAWVQPVRDGLDPLRIEEMAAANLVAMGVTAPAAAMARSSTHRPAIWPGPRPASAADVPHGLCLPGWVIDRRLGEDGRRAAFLRMAAACAAEATDGCLTGGHGSERTTEFSLPRLLPLPAVELLPTWCGRHDPYREGAKRQLWGARTGGLDYARISMKPDGCLVVGGLFGQGGQYDRDHAIPFAALARTYGVAVEITAWNELTRIGRDGALRRRRVLPAQGVAAAVARHRVRSPDHLASLFAVGRYEAAIDCLGIIRGRLLRPPVRDWVSDLAVSATVMAAAAVDGLAALRPVPTPDGRRARADSTGAAEPAPVRRVAAGWASPW
jgi:hypothetical protein